VGFHSLTTTTQPSNVNFHLQGSKVPLGCLPVSSLSPGGAGPKTPWSGTLQRRRRRMRRRKRIYRREGAEEDKEEEEKEEAEKKIKKRRRGRRK
jgi:hypothetical protein